MSIVSQLIFSAQLITTKMSTAVLPSISSHPLSLKPEDEAPVHLIDSSELFRPENKEEDEFGV